MGQLLLEQQGGLNPTEQQPEIPTSIEIEAKFADVAGEIDDAFASGRLKVPEELYDVARGAKATSGPDASNLLYMR